MKRFKIRVVFNLVFLLVIGLIISPNIVNAQKKTSSGSCNNTLFPGGDAITLNKSNYTVNFNLLEGTWDVYYKIGGEDEDWTNVVKKSGGLKNVDHVTYRAGEGAPGALSNIPRREYSQQVFVFMALKEAEPKKGMSRNGDVLTNQDETTCRPGSESSFSLTKDNGGEVRLKSNSTVVVRRFTIPARVDKTNINKSSNKECQLMQQGKYASDGSKSQFDLDSSEVAGYNDIMRQNFPFCYSGSISAVDVTDAAIKAIRKKSLKAYKEYLKFLAAKKDNSKFDAATQEIRNGGYQKISLTNKQAIIGDTLACEKNISTETTKKYYAESVVEDNEVCKVTCQEQFQVTYDPPAVVKAGLCFQYKVTVRSKVTCKTEDKGGLKWPTPPDTCGYVPICENNANETQAGPNDEFDSCINSCDGGKYSQSCINSCYKSVYENTSTDNQKQTTGEISSNENKILKLAKSSKDPYYQDKKCNTNGKISSNRDYCANYFYNIKLKYPMGYYTNSTSDAEKWIDYRWKICWSSDSKKCSYVDDDDNSLKLTVDKWSQSTAQFNNSGSDIIEHIKRSSPYYLRSISATRNLIGSFFAEDGSRNGLGQPRYYKIDNRGIKRQWSSSYQCHETCGYVSDGGAGCKTSSKEIRDYYSDTYETIESNLAKCTAEATCKEDTATFHIDVNDKKTYTSTDKVSWDATNRSDSKATIPSVGGDSTMFIPLECSDAQKSATPLVCDIEALQTDDRTGGINGVCYGRDNPNYWQHYKTTITFPGTWINLKSAERVYKQPNSSEKDKYREKKNYYCTGYDSEAINSAWFHWKVDGKGDINTIKLEKDDNIKANIKDFGKFNWSVSLKCFFGLSNKVDLDCDPTKGDICDDDPPGGGDKCSDENSTALCNYIFRTIDQANMFPDKDGGKGTRKRGFNWTKEATDNTIPTTSTYHINPEEYFKQLESSAGSEYPRSDAEFDNADYRIKLTTDNIRAIKNYVKKNQNAFTTFDGTYAKVTPEVEGLYYYKSSLRNNTTLVSSWQGDLAGKNNN